VGIKIENISKRFDHFQAVDNVSLEVKTGSLVALLGPSGSGKSTLLRLIAGLEQPDAGRVWLTGQDATYQTVQERRVGFVFQHYALFKHLTVRQNIAFGLEIRKWPKHRIKNRVEELIELVQLTGMGDRYPSQLSGGQRQRVALARALAVQPNVLLLDEPFGALDAKVRKDLRNWLRRLHDEMHVTTVFVTHDQEEAMEVSDEIVVMNQGRIEQVGSPAEVYDHTATPFVMSFVGPVNVLPKTAALANSSLDDAAHPHLFLRPHDVEITLTPSADTVPVHITRIIHLGREIQVELSLDDGYGLTAHLTREQYDRLELRPDQEAHIRSRNARVFPGAVAPLAS
jgi:sulfate/thiosulfate transport system ATP-binding protein